MKKTKQLMLRLLMILSFIQISTPISAQVVPNIDWVKHYVWRDSTDNSSTTLDADNNVYVTGYGYNGTDRDLIILKYDSLGTLLWSDTYDNGGNDVGNSIKVDVNGNVFVTGTSYDATTLNDVITRIYDASGSLLMSDRYDAGYSLNDEAHELKLNQAAGNVFIIGSSENGSVVSEVLVLKYKSAWSLDWAQLYDGGYSNSDYGVSLAITSNNDVFCTGHTFNGTDYDIWTFLIDQNGSKYWDNFVAGTAGSDDYAASVVTTGVDAVICGRTNNTTTGDDHSTFRLDGSTGGIIWQQDYDDSNNMNFATSIVRDSIGNIGVTGLVLGGSGWEYHTLMYDSAGTQIWVNKEGTGLWGAIIEPRIAVDTVAHHFYVSGSKQNTTSDVMVYQIIPTSGTTSWRQYHDGPASGFDVGTGISVSGLGIIYLSANEANTSWGYNQTTIRLSQTPIYFPIDSNNVPEPYSAAHYFYPNTGEIQYADTVQTANEVLFYTQNTYPQKYILANHNIAFVTGKKTDNSALNDSLQRVDIEFWKSNPLTQAHSFERVDSGGILNYFLSRLASEVTDVHGNKRLMIPNIYHNIDLHLYSNSSGLKMYWVVKPNTDPTDIILKINGATSDAITSNKLKIGTKFGDFSFEKPHAYYVDSALTTYPATCSWNSLGLNKYSISTGTYNPAWPLVIQMVQGPSTSPASIPGIDWSTFFGGSYGDLIYKSKAKGNELFIVGETTSANFPKNTAVSVYQSTLAVAHIAGFISKFKQTEELQWTTYVHGVDGAERLHDFDFSSNGDIYCVGTTTSFTLQPVNKGGFFDNTFEGGYADGFIFQISPNGQNCIWKTYLGGFGDDQLTACKFGANDHFYVVGNSSTSTLSLVGSGGQYQQSYNTAQVTSGDIYDGIVMKFDGTNSHSLNWFTYYGTSASGSDDKFDDLAISTNSVYVCGYSLGTGIPNSLNSKFKASGTADGIIVAFSVNGDINTAKYTNGNNENHAIEINNNKIYACGFSTSGMTTVNSGSYYFDNALSGSRDAVFSVHSSNLGTTTHNSFLGGSSADEAMDIQFSSNNAMFIAGQTNSTDFPTASALSAYLDNSFNGNYDYFLTCIKDGTTGLLWSTYLGSPTGWEANGFSKLSANIAIDAVGRLYVCGSTDDPFAQFPTFAYGGPPAYFQPALSGWQSDGSITLFDLTDVNTVIGIREFENSISFGLYPNPTRDYLTFDVPDFIDNKVKYEIFNLTGQLVMEGYSGTSNKIDVTKLNVGLYIINLQTEKANLSAKFIKVE